MVPPDQVKERRTSVLKSLTPEASWTGPLHEPAVSVVNIVANEGATFYDVFEMLGIPMIIVFVVSAIWTFMLATIQIHGHDLANKIMDTTQFHNGEFWLLPQPDRSIIVSSVVLLTILGVGYAGLAVTMIFLYRAGKPNGANQLQSDKVTLELASSIKKYHRYSESRFDRAEFLTRMETLTPGSFDIMNFGDPTQISSFCSAFHFLQFSSGKTLSYKSTLNVLSLYKWRKIIMTLICNHHERQIERKRKALVQPTKRESRTGSITAVITKRLSESLAKPRFGKHFVFKPFFSLIFFAAEVFNFVYSIGSVHSTISLCQKYDKCVDASYKWNFGQKHCTCLMFADRETSPTTYAEWIDPEDTTSTLAELAVAGELRIVQITNRTVPELPVELKKSNKLEQLILIYTKITQIPEWLSVFSELEHTEGDFTSRRLTTIADGIFDNMHQLTFLHLGGIFERRKATIIVFILHVPDMNPLQHTALRALSTKDAIPTSGANEGKVVARGA
ncbi:unnamed protein product [Phytophthora lilii]|uniref:Unnamed protein product n=1 Tax=Phytophthora lilii TaxID=2077276 RepID=A0A9W6X0N5_9STRA|nr:unnamed protein product [Phytophthora lilii]